MIESDGDIAVVWESDSGTASAPEVPLTAIIVAVPPDQLDQTITSIRSYSLVPLLLAGSDQSQFFNARIIPTDADGRDLRNAIRSSLKNHRPPGNFAPVLTEREQQVLGFLAHGLTPDQAAQEMHISRNTMKTHLRGVYSKLKVKNRTQAVLEGFRLGFNRPGRFKSR